MQVDTNERINLIEDALYKLTINVDNLTKNINNFHNEMAEFKEEMAEFKDEMSEFKDEMSEFKKETIKDRRNMNKQWGDLANKFGTLVEDIVLPSAIPLIKRYFNSKATTSMPRLHRKIDGREGEFDLVIADEGKLFLFEVKSSFYREYLNDFIENIKGFKELFPEYKDKQIISIFASLSLNNKAVKELTDKNIYAMAYKEWDYMDLLNFNDIKMSDFKA